jgi:DNA-binding CsgD family transcriptional regulator
VTKPSLTDREREVLGLVAGGLTGGEIAQQLVVSPETIKSHVQNAMTKLGAHTRAHAVAISLRDGQIDTAPRTTTPEWEDIQNGGSATHPFALAPLPPHQ